jgi:hypothetical protein
MQCDRDCISHNYNYLHASGLHCSSVHRQYLWHCAVLLALLLRLFVEYNNLNNEKQNNGITPTHDGSSY